MIVNLNLFPLLSCGESSCFQMASAAGQRGSYKLRSWLCVFTCSVCLTVGCLRAAEATAPGRTLGHPSSSIIGGKGSVSLDRQLLRPRCRFLEWPLLRTAIAGNRRIGEWRLDLAGAKLAAAGGREEKS